MNTVMHAGFIFLVLCIGSGEAVYKRWLVNTDFESPLNWNVMRAPCGNDRVLIPNDSPVVYLQTNTSLQELTLPNTGEIILGNNVQLSFTQNPSDDCPSAGGDVEYTAVNPSSWYNPDNWCSTNTELADCQPSSPVDTENVPCVNDDVVFLRHRSYFVTMGQRMQLTLKTLKMSGTSFTTSSFREFVNSTDGRKIFKPASPGAMTSVTITRRSCSDIGGCACGNDQGQMLSAICGIKSKTCERSPCKNPVTPVGACCDMCGAVFNCTRGRGFNLNTFKTKLQNTFFNQYLNVSTAVSVTGAGFLQIVLKDQQGGDGSDSVQLAALIKADMDADLKNGGHKYALDAVALTAESGKTSPHTGGGSAPISGGSIAGIIIGVIILIVIVAAVVLVYKRGRPDLSRLPDWPNWSGFSRNWTRFSNTRQPPSGSATPPRILGPLDPGFNNPLYDSAPFDDGNAREMELRSPMEEQPTFTITGKEEGGFNNPLYASTPGFFTDARDTEAKQEPPTGASHF